MRGSKAKRLRRLRDKFATANLEPPRKVRRLEAWMEKYKVGRTE